MIHRIPGLLDAQQTAAARAFVAQAGFQDGRATNRGSAVKRNEQVEQQAAEQAQAGDAIVRALFAHPLVARVAFPRSIPQPTFSRYTAGMYYGPHLDEALMPTRPRALRSDLSVTVFLSSPDEYEGGELELWLGSEHALVKMAAGDAVLYPTGIIHQVREVTRGTRHVAVTWIQSHIASGQHRQVLHHVHELADRLRSKADATELLLLESVRTNLMRLWMDG